MKQQHVFDLIWMNVASAATKCSVARLTSRCVFTMSADICIVIALNIKGHLCFML